MLKTKSSFLLFICCLFILTTNETRLTLNQSLIANNQIKIKNFEIVENDNVKSFLTTTEGIASYYGYKFHNRTTANGEKFDMYGYTAAHRKLPFGTIVKVVNLKNNKTTLVRINDRGPFKKGRIIDVSYRAARDISGLGIPKVKIYHFNEKNVLANFDDNYYLGYSLCEPFIITRKENVVIINEASDFENAMNTLHLLIEQNHMQYYLFVEVGNRRNSRYCIGYINSETISAPPDFTFTLP